MNLRTEGLEDIGVVFRGQWSGVIVPVSHMWYFPELRGPQVLIADKSKCGTFIFSCGGKSERQGTVVPRITRQDSSMAICLWHYTASLRYYLLYCLANLTTDEGWTWCTKNGVADTYCAGNTGLSSIRCKKQAQPSRTLRSFQRNCGDIRG
jgi:hypothetical protein